MLHERDPFSTERRKSRRTLMAHQISARIGNDEPFPISLVNVSKRGFLASCDRTLTLGMTIRLLDNSDYVAEIIRVSDGMIACRFAREIDPLALLGPAAEEPPGDSG